MLPDFVECGGKQRLKLQLSPKPVSENHRMTKCLNLEGNPRRDSDLPSLWEYSEWNGIWTKPQRNDPDTGNSSWWKKPGEQCLKAGKRQVGLGNHKYCRLGSSSGWRWEGWLESNPKTFGRKESSYQVLALGRLGSWHGEALENHGRRLKQGTDPFPGPKQRTQLSRKLPQQSASL